MAAANGIAKLRTDPKYPDLKIHCEGRVFQVHRAIVCPLSKVLAKECDGLFQVSTLVGTSSSCFPLTRGQHTKI